MKVLWISSESNKDRFYGFIEQLRQCCDLTEHWLDAKQQKHVVKAVGAQQIKRYDRVLLQLPVSQLLKQTAYLRCVPHLVLLQPALASVALGNVKDFDKYLKFLSQAPWIRVLTPPGELESQLRKKKVDVSGVPIGINMAWFKDKEGERTHWAAIIGDMDLPNIKSRRHLLFDIKTQNKLQIFDEEKASALNDQLNNVGVVVVSDEGWKHYRSLNFQTMACGALLMTWDRGEAENRACGFEDMQNVMLYKDAKSAQAKLNFLKRHPDQLEMIRTNGMELVQQFHSNVALARKVAEELQKPLKKFAGDDVEDAVKFRFFR